jgi:ATP-dependent DNA helicase Rep
LKEAKEDDELIAARAYANYGEALAAYQAVDFDDLIVRVVDCSSATRTRARVAGQVRARARRRIPGHQSGAVSAAVRAGGRRDAVHRRRRRRPGDLRLARRDRRQPREPAARLSRLKVVKLEQNYRSTVRILRSANALIGNNPKLFDKRLWSDLGTARPFACCPRR